MIYKIVIAALFLVVALMFLINLISGGYLFGVIRWRIVGKEWIGRRVYIMGKMRPVTGETYKYIFVKGLSHEIRKDNRYLRADGK